MVNWRMLIPLLFIWLGLLTGFFPSPAIAAPTSDDVTATTELASAQAVSEPVTPPNAISPSSSPAVPFVDHLGTHHHPISTQSELAQRYFDQGLILTYGFNHAEALRSFQAAAKADPTCAICYWGMAYVMGPNINAGMESDLVPSAWEAIQTATGLSKHASQSEQAYIQALAQRYTPEPVEDRAMLNRAYANAMRQVARQYPHDLDAATLFAEALMDTIPWDYWQTNGALKPTGREIIKNLDTVLQRQPDHPGALHYYIHVVEKKHPEWAIAVADRLRDLNLALGHLVHMPSHIYLRVGRYQDAVKSNQQAILIDEQYAQQHPEKGIYTFGYMPHNHHFLWYAATMAGQQQVALQAAQETAKMADPTLLRQAGYGTLQHYLSIPLYTLVKFGLWDEILQQPAPAEDLAYPTGVWHYARGMALTAKGQLAQAAKELEQVQTIAASPALDGVTIWDINTTASLLQIGSHVLAGELAAKQGNTEQAVKLLKQAVVLEDNLSYDEPAPWYSPVRQTLARVLQAGDRPAEAEQVYREDLAIYPDNGWSLYGLTQSLKAQGKIKAAQLVQKQFEAAWSHADITLAS